MLAPSLGSVAPTWAAARCARRKVDVLFLQLADPPVITTVFPSKLFEYGSLGKLVWPGGGDVTATFAKHSRAQLSTQLAASVLETARERRRA